MRRKMKKKIEELAGLSKAGQVPAWRLDAHAKQVFGVSWGFTSLHLISLLLKSSA